MELIWWISIYCKDTTIRVQFQWLELNMELMELMELELMNYPNIQSIMEVHDIDTIYFQS